MNHTAHPKTARLISRSWAELGAIHRQARLAGNEALAAQSKQAIEMKKAIRKSRKAR